MPPLSKVEGQTSYKMCPLYGMKYNTNFSYFPHSTLYLADSHHYQLPWGWWCWYDVVWNHSVLWLGERTQWTLHTSAPPWCRQKASTGSTHPVKWKWFWDWTAACATHTKLSSPNFSILHQVWQHHNHTTLSFIDHLPEVSTGGLHWCLSNDKPLPLLVALFRCAVGVWITCKQRFFLSH